MTFTVLFHGTGDTHYPTDDKFLEANGLQAIGDGAHTLSFFADCMVQNENLANEPLFSRIDSTNKDPGLLLLSHELAIINGPDDKGTEVHNLIVTGLMVALNAIMRGERHLFFTGFSRGSVEATHMTHELQRIKTYLNNTSSNLSAEAIVKAITEGCYNPSSFHKWRTNRINDLYRKALLSALQDAGFLSNLINGFRDSGEKVTFNGMLLDPVPGLCEGTAIPSYIPWTTLNFHTQIAPIVDELHTVYMNDELSVGFRAVWIEAAAGAQTKITHAHLPGCHSTANGNPVNHVPAATLARTTQPPFPYQQMRDVQKLYFYKLLQFAHKQGVQFKSPEALTGRYLTHVFEQFVRNNDSIVAQNAYLRTQYQQIASNLNAYRLTRNTSYLPEWLRSLGLGGKESDIKNQERILMTSSGPRNIADCFNFQTLRAIAYVNFESFFLNFIELFFPELHEQASRVSHQINPTSLSHMITNRYASSEDINVAILAEKISRLLEQCAYPMLGSSFNTAFVHATSNNQDIFQQIITLFPNKLVNSFYSTDLTPEDQTLIQRTITRIFNFALPDLTTEESSEAHQQLHAKKAAYIRALQSSMQAAIANQTETYWAYLQERSEQIPYHGLYPQVIAAPAPASSATELESTEQPPLVFDPRTYLEDAERHYQHLRSFHAKFAFSITHLASEKRPILNYQLTEAIEQFPAKCERVLDQRGVDWSNESNFEVLRPMTERLRRHQQLQLADASNARLQSDLEETQDLNKQLSSTLQKQTESLKQCIAADTVIKQELSNIKKTLAAANDLFQQGQELTGSLQQHLNNIQSTLRVHLRLNQYSGFTLQVLGSLCITLGVVMIAVSALIVSSAAIAVPILGLVAGAAITTFGLFEFREGAKREHSEQLERSLFPA